MKILGITGLVLATSLMTTAVFAGPDCTEEPQEKWMSEMDMQKKIVNDYGFTMNMFKVTSGNCYEIYGKAQKSENEDDTDSAEWIKTEIYFHPITGEIVKRTDKD